MKRAGNLIEKIADIDNLFDAYYKARRGKQHKYAVKQFARYIEDNLPALRRQILSGNIEVGAYHRFKIYDPKERVICAAPFSERVLHHAIMNVCKPVFERHLIYDTYATREGKGIYQAIAKARRGMLKHNYVAKLDVRKYFDSISHRLLKVRLQRLFKDKKLLAIFDKIIDSYSVEPTRGIPIGNLTSQYFANYYLSATDHYIKETLQVPVYVRYMDDMLLFADSKEQLDAYVKEVTQFIEQTTLLTLKPCVKNRVEIGISFLGYRLYPHKIRLNGGSKKRFIRKMRRCEDWRGTFRWNETEYMQHITPLLAFVRQAYSKGLRRRVCRCCG